MTIRLISVLRCSKCGRRSAHVGRDPYAWDGWRITPPVMCPACVERGGK